jgi:hypothetical protein
MDKDASKCSVYSPVPYGIEHFTNDTGVKPFSEGKVIYNPGKLAGLGFLASQGLLVEVVDGVTIAFE